MRKNREIEEIQSEPEFIEKVVDIKRCAKVVKGGRRFSFSALVVVGDGKNKVGYGLGKASEVSVAIRKGVELAKRSMIEVPMKDTTIPHEILAKHDGGKVLIKPAPKGTGVIAGGGVRAVLEAAGVRDVLGKSLGSSTAVNVVKAAIKCVSELKNPEDIKKLRGIKAE